MYDQSDRKELLSIFDKIAKDARESLVNDGVLPQSMTDNGKSVGVTIKFRKLYDVQNLPDTAEVSPGSLV